jgi:SIT4 phosphatase-associated protein
MAFIICVHPRFSSRCTDITRECRGDNKRLITYLCRPEVVSALVSLCINVRVEPKSFPAGSDADAQLGPGEAIPPSTLPADDAFADDPFADGGDGVVTGTLSTAGATPGRSAAAAPSGTGEADEETLKKARFTRSYIASELLSADVRPLADALVGDDNIFNSLFSCLESNAPGELDAYVATHFAKIVSSLLKTRNEETLAQMTRRRSDFVNGLLKHLALPAIAELVVRILDGPEVERGYSTVVAAPSKAALDLLVASDVLSGLAGKFVEAASPAGTPVRPSGKEVTHLRRLREETMTHATLAVQGVASRVLQLPSLGVAIPAMLSPYATPAVVLSMVDAGLAAFVAGGGGPSAAPHVLDEGGASSVVAASTSGISAALLHALTLAATLMTTDANVVRDDSNDFSVGGMGGGPTMSGGAGSRQRMLGMGGRGRGGAYGTGRGKGGIGASIQAQRQLEMRNSLDDDDSDEDDDEDGRAGGAVRRSDGAGDADGVEGSGSGGADSSANTFAQLEVGSPITSTASLEAELVTRFERLSEMFGTEANDDAEGRPLGSLRLKLAEFFVACMKKGSQSTVDVIVKLGVPRKLLALFLRYEWSSMLHGVITQSIVAAFDGQARGAPARKAWVDAGLVPWLTNAWALNEQRAEEEEFRFRAGYMGHLIQIGAELQRYVNDEEEIPDANREKVLCAEQLESLAEFSELHLAPAHKLEVTPLCERPGHGGECAEEVYEEATEVFDMGEVMEGLTQGEANQAIDRFAKYLVHRSEADDEEIETVELGDLSHFGGDEDDEEVSPVGIEDDGDIPADLRAAMRRESATAAPPPVAPPPALETMAYTGSGSATTAAISEIPSPAIQHVHGMAYRDAGDVEEPSIVDTEVSSMDFDASAANAEASANDVKATFGDSSDDDGGTYEEFVDAPDGNTLSAAIKDKLKIGESSPTPSTGRKGPTASPLPAASEDADITEIDDGETVRQGAAVSEADVTLLDDGDDSSGGEEWTTFDPANPEQFLDSKGEARLRTAAGK